MSITDLEKPRLGPITWAVPESDSSLGDVFSTAARNQMLTGNIVSEAAAVEEAYDRRIEAVRQATGITLENPERGGYGREARGHLRQDMLNGDLSPIDEKAGVTPYRRRIFDQKVAELQQKHPELKFGGLEEEARSLAIQSGEDLARAMNNPDLGILRYGAQFAGAMWGSRRDPLFLGSLFAGPTTAVGKTALAKIASSALGQGLFNAGLSAVEQPAVQQWRAKLGQESGVVPALQDVGLAFVMGAIPGAGFQALGEGVKAAAPAVRRLLRGEPQPGDITKAVEALGPKPEVPAMTPEEIVAGTMSAEERATTAPPPPAAGTIRFYHGGTDPTSGGPRWLTPHEDYARNFRSTGEPNEVHYVDIPRSRLQTDLSHGYDEINDLYRSFEAPEDIAKQLKPLGPPPPQERPVQVRAMQAGEESLAADKAVLDEPPPTPAEAAPAAVEAGVSQALKDSTRTMRLGQHTDIVADPHAADVLDRGPKVLGEIDRALASQGITSLKPLGGGFESVVLDAGDRVVRMGLGEVSKFPDIPEYLKPIAQETIGGVRVEILPKVDIKGITEADVEAMQARLAAQDMRWTDAATDNLGRDQDGNLKILDGRVSGTKADIPIADIPRLGVPEDLHNDLVAAALKRADDPDAASPQATAAIAGPPGSIDPELQARIQQANPRNAEEAMAAADQALDDFGRRDGMAAMRRQMLEAKELENEATEAWRTDETREKPDRKDIRNRIPMVDRNGKEVMWSERQVASYGKLDELKADLIRSCK